MAALGVRRNRENGLAQRLLALVVAAGLLAGCTDAGEERQSATSAPSKSDTVVGPTGGTVELIDGAVLVVPAGALVESVEVTAATFDDPLELPAGVTAGVIVDVDLGGVQPTKPVTLTFDAADPGSLTGDAGAVVGYHLGPEGPEFLPAILDAEAGTVSVETDSLSPLGFLRIDAGMIRSEAFSAMSAYFGDAVFSVPDPKCDREEEARTGGWSIDSSDSPTLKWCLGMDGDDRVLVIANNRRYPLIVEVPRNVTLKNRSERGFAARVSEAALRDDWIVLDGGGTASWTINQSEGSSIKFRTDFDGLAQAVTSLEVSADWLATLLAKASGGKSGGTAVLLGLIESSGCLRTLIDNTDDQSSFGADDIAKLLTSCLSFDTLAKFAGRFGAAILLAPVGLVLGTGSYFVGAWEGFTNSISGKVNYEILIARAERAVGCSPLTEGPTCPVVRAAEIMSAFAVAWNQGGDWQRYVDGVMESNVPNSMPESIGSYTCLPHGNPNQYQCDFTSSTGRYYALFDRSSMRITWIQGTHGG